MPMSTYMRTVSSNNAIDGIKFFTANDATATQGYGEVDDCIAQMMPDGGYVDDPIQSLDPLEPLEFHFVFH